MNKMKSINYQSSCNLLLFNTENDVEWHHIFINTCIFSPTAPGDGPTEGIVQEYILPDNVSILSSDGLYDLKSEDKGCSEFTEMALLSFEVI